MSVIGVIQSDIARLGSDTRSTETANTGESGHIECHNQTEEVAETKGGDHVGNGIAA